MLQSDSQTKPRRDHPLTEPPSSPAVRSRPVARWCKHSFDKIAAAVGLLLLAPLLLIISAIIRVRLGSPVLFRQDRAGFRGGVFQLIKFRTMSTAVGTDGVLLPDDQRLTGFGRFLRATSLDELPELWNVVRGEMSLVGPRPLMADYLARYSPTQARRHDVRPGVTGWAQVNGRNTVSWDQRFAHDVWYVDNCSIWLDIKILLRTTVLVLLRRGVSAEGFATMPEFQGSPGQPVEPPPQRTSSKNA